MENNFTYAHNDTSAGERKTPTAKFNIPALPERVQKLRESAYERSIPTADDETLNFLITLLSALQPENILELGTATGISGAVMLDVCPRARLSATKSFTSRRSKILLRSGFLRALPRFAATRAKKSKNLRANTPLFFSTARRCSISNICPCSKNF